MTQRKLHRIGRLRELALAAWFAIACWSASAAGTPPSVDSTVALTATTATPLPAGESQASTAPATQTTGATLAPLPRGEIHGFTQTRFRARRFSPQGQDRDIYQFLSMDFGDPDEETSGSFYLRGNHLLSGRNLALTPAQAALSRPALRDLNDTFGDPFARLYYGYVDVRNTGPFDRVRAGRQSIPELPGFLFDGVRVEDQASDRMRYTVYGGRAAHLYEDNQSDDWLFGAGIERSLTEALKLRLDIARVEDRMEPRGPGLPFNPAGRDEADTMIALGGFWNVRQDIDVEGRVVRIDDTIRSLRAAGNFRRPDDRLFLTVSAERQPDPLFGMSTELSPYFDVLGGYAAYSHLSLHGSKGIGEDIDFSFGYFNHDSDADAGLIAFNQDYDRWFTGLYFPSLFGRDRFSLSLNFDKYSAELDEFYTVGGELGFTPNRRTRLTAGSSYAQYEFDPLSGRLRDHVREYYVGADWKALTDWRIRSRFVVEPFQDGDTFRTLELSVRHDF